jgi:hypothetical protein
MEQPSSIEDLLAGANGLPDRSLPRPHGPGEVPPRPDLLAEATGTGGVGEAEPAHFLQLAGGPLAFVHDPQDVAGLCCLAWSPEVLKTSSARSASSLIWSRLVGSGPVITRILAREEPPSSGAALRGHRGCVNRNEHDG